MEGRATLFGMFQQKAVLQVDPAGYENRDPLNIIADTGFGVAPADASRGFSPTSGYLRNVLAALDKLTPGERGTLVWRQFGFKLQQRLVKAVPEATRPRLRDIFPAHKSMRWKSIVDLQRLIELMANFDKQHCEVLRVAFSSSTPRVHKVSQSDNGRGHYTPSCFLCGDVKHKMDNCPKKHEVCKHKRKNGSFWPLTACFRCSPRGRIAELYYQKMVTGNRDTEYIKKRLPELWKLHGGNPIVNLQKLDLQPARVNQLFTASYTTTEVANLWGQ